MRRELTEGRRPSLTVAEVYTLIGDDVALPSLYQAVKTLRERGALEFAKGSKRRMTLGTAAPLVIRDQRGRMPGSMKARKHSSFATGW